MDNKVFLNCFWDLAVDNIDLRSSATKNIYDFIDVSENKTENLKYALKRLVKGLSSSREFARQGFSSCLSYLLHKDLVTIQEVIDLIEETTIVI
jgi:hypothetical protein